MLCKFSEVMLIHEGQPVPNNSLISLGELNDSSNSPLVCITNQPSCCDTNRSGNWISPSGEFLSNVSDALSLFQRWEDNQTIELHSRSVEMPIEEGLYHCEVPDKDGVVKRLYIGVYSFLDEGKLL